MKVVKQTPETKRFQYRIDGSINPDHPNILEAERVTGYHGSDTVEINKRFTFHDPNFSRLISERLTRKQTEMLRELLNAVLADWSV